MPSFNNIEEVKDIENGETLNDKTIPCETFHTYSTVDFIKQKVNEYGKERVTTIPKGSTHKRVETGGMHICIKI